MVCPLSTRSARCCTGWATTLSHDLHSSRSGPPLLPMCSERALLYEMGFCFNMEHTYTTMVHLLGGETPEVPEKLYAARDALLVSAPCETVRACLRLR